MKILFINPNLPVYLRLPSLPLGLVSIASYLQAYGHKVKISDRSVQKINIKTEMQQFQPDIVGVSALSYSSSKDAIKVTKYIHSHFPNIPVIWGGQAASSAPELYLREGGMDYLILGEGEITWKEFVDAWEGGRRIKAIKGLAYLENGAYICNPIRPVADLTEFPELDWTLVQPEKYFSSFFHCSKMLYLHASKGCTAKCIFCTNTQFHQGRTRCRQPEHVFHDLQFFVKKCGADGIYFSDEQFMPNRTIRTRLLKLIIDSDLDFVWGCQIRLGVLNAEDIDLMYEAGCRWILFGIESGSPETIKRIKKGIDLSLAKPTIDHCMKRGITVQASFIMGFPEETEEQLHQTVDFAKMLSASLPVMNILVVPPNSEIYFNQLETNPNYHPPKGFSDLVKIERRSSDNPTVNLSRIPMIELKVIHYYFQWKDFSGKNSVENDKFGIIKMLVSDTLKRIFKRGLIGFFYGCYSSVVKFVTVFFYSHCFPAIVKKYGLNHTASSFKKEL